MKTTLFTGLFLSVWSIPLCLWAGDGLDNNYIGDDANELALDVGLPSDLSVFFGPSNGTYGIVIPNGGIHNLGTVSYLRISSVYSRMRSAYYDRVFSTTFYYRIYPADAPPANPAADPANFPNSIAMTHVALSPSMCFETSQGDNWSKEGLDIDLLDGLANGIYVMEFFNYSDLIDWGDETDLLNSGCVSGGNSSTLCQFVNDQDRYLKSTYNTVDPTTCNYADVVAMQSIATRLKFAIGVAPLSWTAFSIERLQKDARLQWSTEQEVNVDKFLIERANNLGGWLTIGEMTANNKLSPNEYAYIDREVPQDQLYYRIRSVDFDGTYQLSPVLALAAQQGVALKIMPNPASHFADLLVKEGSNVQIFDVYGQLVFNDPRADGALRIETHDWTTGVYSIWVLGESGTVLERALLVVKH